MLLPLVLLAPPPIRWSESSRPAPGVKGGLVLPDGRLLVVSSQRAADGRNLVLHATRDGGETWQTLGTVGHDGSARADLGDGNLVRLRSGTLLATFRRNHAPSDYAIEVAQSDDAGRTWRPHSIVDAVRPEGPGPSRGFWAPFLFLSGKGEVQCYYDNEHLPWKSQASGHQWVTMRTWRKDHWSEPIVVAREPEGLSRDGMPTVVGLGKRRLLCVVEAVRREAPHAGVLRGFPSNDDGRTWGPPRLVYAPKDPRFHAFAPSMVRIGNRLVLAFATNEDRAESPPSGTPPPRMNLDVKAIVSEDGGASWGAPSLVYGGDHQNYLPILACLDDRRLLATFVDFRLGARSVEGRIGP